MAINARVIYCGLDFTGVYDIMTKQDKDGWMWFSCFVAFAIALGCFMVSKLIYP